MSSSINTLFSLRSSQVSVIISIALLLFMLGILGVLLFNAQKLTKYVKENFIISVIIKDSAKEISVRQFQKTISSHSFVKSSEMFSKDEAAQILAEELGEDFIKFLGYNPLSSSIDIHFKEIYANTINIEEFKKTILNNIVVEEVLYDKNLINVVNNNIKKISAVFLCICLIFTLIAFALINNSIRLAIYSKRFIIKTMQLVGATKFFIQKPFLSNSILLGFFGGLIGSSLLAIFLSYLHTIELVTILDPLILILLFITITILGICLALVSTFFAVKKYLKLTTDQLYL